MFEFIVEKLGARYIRFLGLFKFALKRAVLSNTLGWVLLVPILFLTHNVDPELAMFTLILAPIIGSLIVLTGSWLLALVLRSRWLRHWYTADLCPMAGFKWDLLCGVVTMMPGAGIFSYMAFSRAPFWGILVFPSVLGVPVAGAVVLSLMRILVRIVKKTTRVFTASKSAPHTTHG